jgi:hypothetical protein
MTTSASSTNATTNTADRRELGLRFYLVALALLAFFALTILNGALPLRLLDPTWQLSLIQLLLSQAFLPLIALVLLHLAVAHRHELTLVSADRTLVTAAQQLQTRAELVG